jgi:UDP-N-acetylglucosamine diphosphorylase / glucose-1-phosphate thymidylyltransferase / UDP-N-acetylgalactosamine diphosphorylase / glucosamine-1-phosphate N-acetyltransferase / galactosamine-1-phosphate N-acetyltransferase
MVTGIHVSRFVHRWQSSPFAEVDEAPWHVTQKAESLLRGAIIRLADGYRVEHEVAVHASATIDNGAVLKGPAIIGPRCFVAAAAYLRGGVYLEEDCIVGPGSELKTSFMFKGSKIAHLNFVGDSILGSGVNIEAGAIIANYRNERTDKEIRISVDAKIVKTGVDKFGALVGDNVRIGANAVIAPGALLLPCTKIGRLQLVDQAPHD